MLISAKSAFAVDIMMHILIIKFKTDRVEKMHFAT